MCMYLAWFEGRVSFDYLYWWHISGFVPDPHEYFFSESEIRSCSWSDSTAIVCKHPLHLKPRMNG